MALTSRPAHLEEARAILLHLSDRARHAREAFLGSADVENVHALRGALRRGADGVCLLEGFLLTPDVVWLHRELRWQARRLGNTRDLDVLSARLVAKHPYTADFRPADLLIASARTRRDAEVEKAKAELLSARAVTLADGLELVFLRALESGEGGLHFGDVISSWLRQADSAIRIGEKRLMALGRRERHKLRGRVRTLRYNCEACSSGSSAEAQYIAAVIVLQTALGEMNDDAVCAALCNRLTHCGDLDKVPGLEPTLHQIHRRGLKRAWRALDGLPLPDFAQAQQFERPVSSPIWPRRLNL